jgi:CRP-like cAMP-binding protein
MSRIVRLTTKRQMADQQAAATIAEQLELITPEMLEGAPGDLKLLLSRAIYSAQKQSRPNTEGLWPGGFTMISRDQTKLVWDAIRALPPEDRPQQVRHAFDLALLSLRQDTGEIMMRRDELAEEIGCSPQNVSQLMGVLERMGAVRRTRQKVPGMRGPGVAVYYINPHVGWNGSLDARKAEADESQPPMLVLMEGGKS